MGGEGGRVVVKQTTVNCRIGFVMDISFIFSNISIRLNSDRNSLKHAMYLNISRPDCTFFKQDFLRFYTKAINFIIAYD